MAFYVDTSALVKLVVAEAETAALLAWLGQQTQTLVASDLARAELFRATRRAAPDRLVRAREVLDILVLTEVGTAIFEQAGRLEPPALRTLDALHLASALDLGDDLDGMVTYDDRLASAAQLHGVPVIGPRT
jgi:predicted nucleic acid-binding protein